MVANPQFMMTKEERHEICKTCAKRKLNLQHGIVCSLTGELPAFEGDCEHYEQDQLEVDSLAEKEDATDTDMLAVSSGIRFFGYLLDIVFYYIFSFLFGIVMGLLGFVDFIFEMNETLLGLLLIITYYVMFEATLYRTPGKLILNTIVVTEEGGKPSFLKILGRTLCRFIPFEAFSFLFNPNAGWHDTISGTRVIKYSGKKAMIEDDLVLDSE